MSDVEDRPDEARTPVPADPWVEHAVDPIPPIVVEQPVAASADSYQPSEPVQHPPAAAEPADYGWPLLPPDPASNGATDPIAVGGDGMAPPPAPPSRRSGRHSRNPVDRLTRGLPDGLRITIDWVVTIAGAIAIVLLVKAYVVNPYRIPSSSMEPTLHCSQPAIGCETKSLGPLDLSDRVLANRFLYRIRDPRRGEIVVFKTPPAAQIKCGAGGTFVKRLIGLPGDTVELRLRNGDGYVYINGKPLKEPYIEPSRRGAVQGFGPIKVKPDHYFMLGDNRASSCDSRFWGTVPRANLIGKVFATYWPPRRISLH